MLHMTAAVVVCAVAVAVTVHALVFGSGVDICVFKESYILFGSEDFLDFGEVCAAAFLFHAFAFGIGFLAVAALLLLAGGALLFEGVELGLLVGGEVEAFKRRGAGAVVFAVLRCALLLGAVGGVAVCCCAGCGFLGGCAGDAASGQCNYEKCLFHCDYSCSCYVSRLMVL